MMTMGGLSRLGQESTLRYVRQNLGFALRSEYWWQIDYRMNGSIMFISGGHIMRTTPNACRVCPLLPSPS